MDNDLFCDISQSYNMVPGFCQASTHQRGRFSGEALDPVLSDQAVGVVGLGDVEDDVIDGQLLVFQGRLVHIGISGGHRALVLALGPLWNTAISDSYKNRKWNFLYFSCKLNITSIKLTYLQYKRNLMTFIPPQ